MWWSVVSSSVCAFQNCSEAWVVHLLGLVFVKFVNWVVNYFDGNNDLIGGVLADSTHLNHGQTARN